MNIPEGTAMDEWLAIHMMKFTKTYPSWYMDMSKEEREDYWDKSVKKIWAREGGILEYDIEPSGGYHQDDWWHPTSYRMQAEQCFTKLPEEKRDAIVEILFAWCWPLDEKRKVLELAFNPVMLCKLIFKVHQEETDYADLFPVPKGKSK